MGIEDLIFWLFLGFALFSRVFAWIIDRLRGQSTQSPPQQKREPEPIDDFFDDDWAEPGEAIPAPPPKTTPAPAPVVSPARVATPVPVVSSARLATPAMATTATTPVTAAEQGQRLRRKLGLDQRSALQRSVLLMSVLGPCRANERDSDPRSRSSF